VRESQDGLTGTQQYYDGPMTMLESAAGQHQPENIAPPPPKSTDASGKHLISVALRLPSPAMTQEPRLSD
jgi:hypothetical protein